MKIFHLKTLATIQVGYQARAKIKEDARGTHRLIQGKDFDASHTLQMDELASFFPERKPELYAVQKGDVLFQARGTEHFAYCITTDLKNTLAASSFYIIRLKTKSLLPEYLAWWINQRPSQSYFQTHGGGTGISFVSKNVLSLLKVKVPPIVVQEKIKKVISLLRREQDLLDRLADHRARLVKAICLKSIT
jgi:hypothetical protein